MSVETQKITVIEAPYFFSPQDNVDFLDIVEKAIDTGVRTININCTKLKNMSSSQVSLIWQANLMCKEADVKMILCDVHKTIIGVLHTMDLYEVFIIKAAVDITAEETDLEKISSRSIPMFSMKFAPKSENIMHIKYLLNQHLRETQLDEQFIYEIETVFYEVTTNIR